MTMTTYMALAPVLAKLAYVSTNHLTYIETNIEYTYWKLISYRNKRRHHFHFSGGFTF